MWIKNPFEILIQEILKQIPSWAIIDAQIIICIPNAIKYNSQPIGMYLLNEVEVNINIST